MIDITLYLLIFVCLFNAIFPLILGLVDFTWNVAILREKYSGWLTTLQDRKWGWIDSVDDNADAFGSWLTFDLLGGLVFFLIGIFLLIMHLWWVLYLPLVWVAFIFGGRLYVDRYNKDHGTNL